MIKHLGNIPVTAELKALARTGHSTHNSDGFTNGVTLSQIQPLVTFAKSQGYVSIESHAANFWGRCHIRPYKDGVESNTQLLWVIHWTDETEFYSGNHCQSLTPGGVYLFHSCTDLHGVYTERSRLWSCFVLDVEAK
jgi:hypothetical protein